MSSKSKQRILWVAKSSSRTGIEEIIADRLEREYELVKEYDLIDLSPSIVLSLLQHTTLMPFRALVTHVPYGTIPNPEGMTKVEFYRAVYKTSLETLREVKDLAPSMRIIAYTGADRVPAVRKIFVKDGPIDKIVFKSPPEEWENDYRKILAALREK